MSRWAQNGQTAENCHVLALQCIHTCLPCTEDSIRRIKASLLQGEDQKKLDILADNVFVNVLTRCGQCAVLVQLLPPLISCWPLATSKHVTGKVNQT